ncbi:MAG: peptidoglycan editing factor PgeF [Clostridia bacterium]|nr:peptidoglycan editing factor PgeF [Clostridia bacterium]
MKDLSNENVIHVNKNGVEYLQFRKLLQYKDNISHCFTLKDLSFGDNSNFYNIKDNVLEDYNKITNELQLDIKNIVRPFQTHTNFVKNVTNEKGIFIDELKNIDGLLTDRKDEILSLTFADCTPIYLYDKKKNVIGNIHSGWKGTLNKIGKLAVKQMIRDYGCNPQDIICCIGPTIRKCHFEVDEDVKDMFYEAFNNINIISLGKIKDGKQKYYIDTVLANINMMRELGLKNENIIDSKICTVCNCDKIHSYRVDKNFAGRNTALITIK